MIVITATATITSTSHTIATSIIIGLTIISTTYISEIPSKLRKTLEVGLGETLSFSKLLKRSRLLK